MFDIPIYSVERNDGLEQKIKTEAKVTLAGLVETADAVVGKDFADKVLKATKAQNENQLDLFYMKSLLVSTGWNLNTDVFDTKETWLARQTPEDKPINIEHQETRIVGHMTGTYPVNDKMEFISADSPLDVLPAKFHLINHGVLYKAWTDKDRQEAMATLLSEIQDGKWYVSMEALFNNFDYAIIDGDVHQVIARNDKTAFLTKHLKSYGGTGLWNGKKVGRLLRNIVFSGKGLVKNPANPNSVIFKDTKVFSSQIETVYSNLTEKENNEMADNLEVMQKKVDELTKQNADLQSQLKEHDVKNYQKQIDDLTKVTKAQEDKIVQLENEAKTHVELSQKFDESKKKVDELTKSLSEKQTILDKIEADRKKESRINLIIEKMGHKRDEAVSLAEMLESLAEDKFTAYVEKHKKVESTETPKVETDAAKAEKVDVDAAKATADTAVVQKTEKSENQVLEHIKAYYKREGDK